MRGSVDRLDEAQDVDALGQQGGTLRPARDQHADVVVRIRLADGLLHLEVSDAIEERVDLDRIGPEGDDLGTHPHLLDLDFRKEVLRILECVRGQNRDRLSCAMKPPPIVVTRCDHKSARKEITMASVAASISGR